MDELRKKKYVIWILGKSNRSNGVKALRSLADALLKSGLEVLVWSADCSRDYDYKYINTESITKEIRENDIVVYPESVKGNPLRFQNVVRWVLYFPGQIGDGENEYHKSEQLFTWAKKYYNDIPVLCFPCVDEKLFYNDGKEKTENCYFIHKGGKFREIPEIEGFTEINMTYPETKEKFAELLRKTKVLYSYDRYSAVLNEAMACGAQVKIIEKGRIIDLAYADIYTGEKAKQNLKKFIKITQDMNYKGELQTVEINWFYFMKWHLMEVIGIIFFYKKFATKYRNKLISNFPFTFIKDL
jgi:hypothetical protein